MHRLKILWALVFWFGALPLHAAFADVDTLEGTFALVADQSADISNAIETAIASMNFIKRPIARNRLKKTNTAYQRILLARTQDSIEITFDQRAPLRLPANGSAVKWTREDGEVFDVSAQWEGRQLTQTYKASDGMRINTFRLSDDGRSLQLDVAVTSEQLPQAVRYTLLYRRSE